MPWFRPEKTSESGSYATTNHALSLEYNGAVIVQIEIEFVGRAWCFQNAMRSAPGLPQVVVKYQTKCWSGRFAYPVDQLHTTKPSYGRRSLSLPC